MTADRPSADRPPPGRPPPASPAALQRALKRRVWNARWTFQASTAAGLEPLLADEVRELLPGETLQVTSGRVRVEAPFDAIYRLAMGLRTADVLRLRIAEEAAATFPILRDHLGRVSWSWWLPPSVALDVAVRSRRSRLRDDAGLERTLRQAVRSHGIEDRGGKGAPRLALRLDVDRDRASVWVDVAGEPLHRRTGDRWTVPGALRETTAAALALAADVRSTDLIVDPFCGAGTVLEEAGAVCAGRWPGRDRRFAMEASPAWNAGRRRHAARSVPSPGPVPPRVGIDVGEAALRAARHNAALPGIAGAGEDAGAGAPAWLRADARDVDLPALADRFGAVRPLLIANPPYGRRVAGRGADPAALVAQVIDGVPGWRVALLFPEPDALLAVSSLRVDRIVRFRMRGLPNAVIVGSVGARDVR